ncbi:hypothetical protein DN730_16060 [Marinomonas piezotolerans]|uniref:DUF6161 domain-containing protein n=1 Tax=Marinomonas piezotolerans TaxID=2213058 RepID=A0A370U5G4_9GAMM|nr:DUF6161 domain-containing protein [Marinomonas piezotolerans]RDL43019.1 hypothetical protein DN730_16060 [Marinomonas piezotolerans]
MESGLKMEERNDGISEVISITLPLNDNDTGMTFHDVETLKSFLKSEEEAWKWLQQSNKYRDYATQLHRRLNELFLQPLNTLMKQWESANKVEIEGSIQKICLHLKYIDFPFHNRNIGRFVRDQPTEIAINLVYLLMSGRLDSGLDLSNTIVSGLYPQSNSRQSQQFEQLNPYRYRAAVLLGDYYKFGVASSDDYLTNRIEELEGIMEGARKSNEKLTEYFADLEESVTNWSSKFVESNESKQSEVVARSDKFARRLARDLIRKSLDFRKSVDAKYEESLQVVEQAKDTYLSQVELDASVQYWKTKGQIHKRSKNSWMGGLFSLVAMIALTPYLLHGRFSSADSTVTADSAVGVLKSLGTNPLELVSTILAISAISYLIKFFAKQYSTQQHLYLEAEERKVMLMTYLALMNENKLKEQEDRKVALDTLFRPAQTGIFNDASHNIVPSDTIVKIFERQSSKPN